MLGRTRTTSMLQRLRHSMLPIKWLENCSDYRFAQNAKRLTSEEVPPPPTPASRSHSIYSICGGDRMQEHGVACAYCIVYGVKINESFSKQFAGHEAINHFQIERRGVCAASRRRIDVAAKRRCYAVTSERMYVVYRLSVVVDRERALTRSTTTSCLALNISRSSTSSSSESVNIDVFHAHARQRLEVVMVAVVEL